MAVLSQIPPINSPRTPAHGKGVLSARTASAAGGAVKVTDIQKANQLAWAVRKDATASSSLAAKNKPTFAPPQYQRKPPPFLLSNFFNPFLNQIQIPIVEGNNHILSAVQGKKPIVHLADNFPSLPRKVTNVKPSTFETGNVVGQHIPVSPKNQAQQSTPLSARSTQPPLKSYREAVSVTWSKEVDVSFASSSVSALSKHNGEPALFISEEEELLFAESFRFALIGKFIQGRPAMADIRKDLQFVGFSGECHVGLIDQRHVIFQFQLEVDFQRFWLKKIWTCRGFQAKIFRWTTEFCPQKEPSIAPVWINFPLLPVHLCNKDTLFSLGSAVGKPLKLDLATAAVTKVLRPSEARICIELDVLKPLPQRVWIETKQKGMWQQIIYEDLPEYCTTCDKMGHSVTNCKLKQTRKVWVRKDHGKNLESRHGPEVHTQPAMSGDKSCPQDKVQEGNQFTEMQKNSTSQRNVLEEGNIFNSKAHEEDHALTIVVGTDLNHERKNLDSFFTKLGQLLQFIKRKDRETDGNVDLPSPLTGLPLDLSTGIEPEGLESHSHISALEEKPVETELPLQAFTPALEVNNSLDIEVHNEPRHWEEGESSGVHKVFHNSDLAILKAMETLVRDEGKLSSSTSGLALEYQFAKSDLEILSKMESNLTWEEDEHSVFRVKSTSDLDQLQYVMDPEYETDDYGFDRWTENSYEEDEVAMVRGVIDGAKVKQSAADFAHIFSRANLKDVKKQKNGMSDRVLRSMSRASNSDPCRAGSL